MEVAAAAFGLKLSGLDIDGLARLCAVKLKMMI